MKIQSGVMIAAALILGAGCDGDERVMSPQPNLPDQVSFEGESSGSALMSVVSVDPDEVKTTVFDDFSDLTTGFHAGLLVRTGAQYAETFTGVPITHLLTWDWAVANTTPGNASSPLTLVAGPHHENLYGVSMRSMELLAGCGPVEIPANAGANCEKIDGTGRGTGAVSILFDTDTDVVVLELVAPLGLGDGGTGDLHGNWVTFYDRAGNLIDHVQVGSSAGCSGSCAEAAFRAATLDAIISGTQFGKTRWAFQVSPGQLIAGVLFENQTGAFGASGIRGEFGTKIARVEWNRLPVASCQNVTVTADPGHLGALVPVSSIDDGSADATGGPVTLSLRRAPGETFPIGSNITTFGVFPIGTTPTILVVTNDLGNESTCEADVTVNAPPPPTPVDPHLLCNVPIHRTISPPDAPITFTATGTDGIGAIPVTITGYECYSYNGSGKRVDKGESCIVSTDGASITVHDAGGVGDFISWMVEPTAGGDAVSCQVAVVQYNQ